VEKMKYYTFKRESNEFTDILKDPALKELIKLKIKWNYHLMIGLSIKAEEGTYGYIVLKYGEELVNPINKDFTPIPGVDFIPKRT
jgi:hypothetical protein